MVDDIPLKRNYKCYIDCGAANGETFSMLEKINIESEILVMFEPDNKTFSKLKNIIKSKINNFNGNIFLYPCAVYSSTELVNFDNSGTAGSCISKLADNKIQGIALDDVIVNLDPTFIKMDIEGSEYEALLGAKETICRSKPDLAICVYHSINHIWDIPLLINSWNLNYKFYLRSHNIYGMNIVLYAISN
jgi:FkbM family methyltransferase